MKTVKFFASGLLVALFAAVSPVAATGTQNVIVSESQAMIRTKYAVVSVVLFHFSNKI